MVWSTLPCRESEIAGGTKFLEAGEDPHRVSLASTRHEKSSFNFHSLESN